ncbi:hypothetical protein BUALT_Bualt02G0155100 [Buddleja alternifolia]|uniref:Calmodulin-binding domain-containing protein n=1 Tax=Buddleja alternifolia TaxID=168488 RepID=A0AAV6Y179_9LAMI|nr:hypothetical protein BUALT_Bualt02G0155100 [Buddleja alternifolia]
MAKITMDIPTKIGPKPAPPRRSSTDNSAIQISKPKTTTRDHIRASSDSHHAITVQPKKIEPRPGPLRRYSIGPDKIDPKTSPPRRYSTGNSGIKISEPKPTPNYLRASTGSCHDICKYGIKYEFRTKSRSLAPPPPPLAPKRDQNVNIMRDERSVKNYKGKKALQRKQPFGTKSTFTHQSAVRQPNKTFLKRSNNIQNSKTSVVSSVKVPRASKSLPGTNVEIKNRVKNSMAAVNTSYEDVPEKIIHVIEPENENQSNFSSSSSNENKNLDLSAENRINATTRDRRVVIPEEKDSSYPRKLKFWKGKILEIQNANDDYMEKKRLRKVVCDGKLVHMNDGFIRAALRRQGMQTRNSPVGLMNSVIEETATKLVQMRKSKVEALVGAFECVINLQDTETSRTTSTAL